MPGYHLIPKTPLLFRDSRPFGANEHAETLAFPLPSTVAGALRTLYGDQETLDYSLHAEKLLCESVVGPLLTRISRMNNQFEILLPAPADVVEFATTDSNSHFSRLKPIELLPGEGMDLPNGLLAVGLRKENKSKPAKKSVRFWYLEQLISWLIENEKEDYLNSNTVGVKSLPIDVRTHIAIAGNTLAAEDGKLFQTACLDFNDPIQSQVAHESGDSYQYGLLLNSVLDAKSAYRKLGGESRLAYFERNDQLWPTFPQVLQTALNNKKYFRLQFITPAIFRHGWKPNWLNDDLIGVIPNSNVQIKLRALALPRWQAVSGWDMQKGSYGQKSLRRMVPAGAVYWFEIVDGQTMDYSRLWLASVSDENAESGFGLVVPGVWKRENDMGSDNAK